MLINFVIAMLHYPSAAQKAQAELDTVVGRERVPELDDKDNLPYLQAIVREVLRWRPPIPLGIPHAMTEDTWFKGYLVTKGSFVIGNIW